MSWDFETEPEYQQKLDWADAFVRENVEPLDLIWPRLAFTPPSQAIRKVIDPLKQAVREQGLWATHLGPELGGQGHGAVRLCLLNEILGRSGWAPGSSAARPRTPATPRSSRTTVRPRRRSGTCGRCLTARCSPASR